MWCDPRVIGSFHLYSRMAAYASCLLGAAVLLGWLLDVAFLKSVASGLVTMKPNTALGFLACGAALLGIAMDNTAGRWLALAASALGLLIGTLTLAQMLSGRDLGIDQLLFSETLTAVAMDSPGRMAPGTAVCLVLSATALSLYLIGSTRATRWAQGLALLVLSLGGIAALGYMFDIDVLYRIGLYSSMAVHTAFGFVLLGIGLLTLKIERGWLAVYASSGPGGVLLRRMLPAVILLPVLMAWLALQGERAGWYEIGFRSVLLTVMPILLLVVLAWSVANRLNADHRRLRSSQQLFQSLFESAPDAILLLSGAGRIEQVNQETERLFLRDRGELLGRPLAELMPAAQACFVASDSDYCAIGNHRQTALSLSTFVLRKTGTRLPVAVKLGEIASEPETAYLAIIRDMSEADRAEAEIRELNARLEQRVQERTAELEVVNRELEAFSYSVSHDLRAPLRAIAGFSGALLEDCADTLDAANQGHLRRIQAAAKRMDALIRDLLDLSRVTRANLDKQPTDLSALASEVAQELLEAQPLRAVDWVIAADLQAMADARLLRLVLENLFGNALKFTRKQARARIEFGTIGAADETAYFVRDNGVGFDGGRVGELFAPFRRLHNESDFEGSGVGLATVQRIIHRHGGRVWADSAPGEGATFYFTLA